jgi:poly-beta-1,6-N-acetyl-D-glucosamine synthase
MNQIVMKKKYVIVSPVRNEEEYIEKTILSVIKQTIQPVEYMIVDDGSTDSTGEIIARYAANYSRIKTVKRKTKPHSPGAGVVDAFYEGFDALKTKDWDFVIKLDGDLEFEPEYFETLINEFASNPKLGLASGVTYEPDNNGGFKRDSMPDDHVRGAAKMYRRKCWNDIGGLQRVLGWDTIDELKAQVQGWETRSYKQLKIIHYKPIGYKQTNVVKREIKAGERQHYLGYLSLFAILRGFYRMLQKPYLVAGALNIYGFTRSRIFRTEQIREKELVRHLQSKQWDRLTFRRKLLN